MPEKQGKGRGPKNQGLKSASSSSDMNMNHNQQGETSMSQAVKHAIAISTAQVIAANNNHPRQREVRTSTLDNNIYIETTQRTTLIYICDFTHFLHFLKILPPSFFSHFSMIYFQFFL